MLHKAKAQFDASNTGTDRSNDDTIFIRYPRRFHRRHSDKQKILVQNAVASGVMRKREGHPFGPASKYDRCARDPKRRIPSKVFDELLRGFAKLKPNGIHYLFAFAPSEHPKCE